MNNVVIIGRLTKNPEVRYISQNQMAVCKFTVAVDRRVKAGEEKKADFLPVTCFGRTAENCERFLSKGRKVAVQGRLQTGNYEDKNGVKHYTTDIIADMVEFIDFAEKVATNANESVTEVSQEHIPQGFAALNEDIPF